MPLSKKLLKTLLEKEKILVTSIFSFSHDDFNPIKDKFQVWESLNLSSVNAFNLDKSKNVLYGNQSKYPTWKARKKAGL